MWNKQRYSIYLLVAFLVGSCAPPGLLPDGLTPIPTLVPATSPAEFIETSPTPAFANLSYPAGMPSAESGRELYQQYCADCHGENGEGLVAQARNFSDEDYMHGETPVSFYVALTEGVGDMPGFQSQMTSDERWDVVFYVWQFQTDEEDLTQGASIYAADCEGCHGPVGTNEELGAVDFSDVRIVGQIAPRDFFQVITQGKGSMPAWQGRLTQDERWDVIDYLYSFAYQSSFSPLETSEEESLTESDLADTGCPEGAEGRGNPYSWEDQDIISRGQAIYDQSCAGCHGEDGTGNMADTEDFSTAAFQEHLREEGGVLYCIVAEGEGAMPGWGDSLTEEEIWQVLTYIGSLGK